MGGRGMEDDLELEVSDLRTGRVADIPPAGQRVGAREGADERGREPAAMGVADADAGGTPAAGAPERQARRRGARLLASRRARGSAVAGLVLLVCAGLLLSLPGPRQALRQALAGPTPTPTATLAPGADVVYFEQSAPWGRLTLDGNPLLIPQSGRSRPLPRGRHTLTYEAAPWAPLRCQISVPAQQGDTCPIDNTVRLDNAGAARMIDLGATLDTLPDAQRAALTSAVASAFQANVGTAEVQAGDHYLGADGTPAVATSPLRAALTLTLNTDPARPALDRAPPHCVTLCVFGGGGAIDWWVVYAHVVARWQFAASDGTTIQPGASADLDIGYQLGAKWSGTWSVALQIIPGGRGQPCGAAFLRAFPDGTAPPSDNGWGVHQGPSDADGCVWVASPGAGGGGASGPNATPTPLPAGAAIFIVRFGVVLAGSDAAHAAQPQLPIASAHERALAQQWMGQR